MFALLPIRWVFVPTRSPPFPTRSPPFPTCSKPFPTCSPPFPTCSQQCFSSCGGEQGSRVTDRGQTPPAPPLLSRLRNEARGRGPPPHSNECKKRVFRRPGVGARLGGGYRAIAARL
eukprot:gene10348-biopygen1654